MKVLQEPNQEPAWTLVQRCTGEGNGGHGCGATLLVDRADVFNSNTFTRPFLAFRCPLCAVVTDIDHALWPADWERSR